VSLKISRKAKTGEVKYGGSVLDQPTYGPIFDLQDQTEIPMAIRIFPDPGSRLEWVISRCNPDWKMAMIGLKNTEAAF